MHHRTSLNTRKQEFRFKRLRQLLFTTKGLGILLLAPAVIFILITVVYPMAYSFFISFFDWNLVYSSPTYIGVTNYIKIYQDVVFWNSLRTSLVFTFSSVFLELLIGLAMALLLNRKIHGVGMLRTIFAMPFVITPVVVALMWKWLYNPDYGLIPWVLDGLGMANSDLLGNPKTALGAVIGVEVWQTTGFMFVLLLAGLQSIPNELYEASYVDGASSLQSFRFVTLPLLKPVLLTSLLLRTIDAIKGLDKFYILTGGGPGTSTEVLPLLILENAFRYFNVGYGAALSYILTSVILLVSFIYIRTLRAIK